MQYKLVDLIEIDELKELTKNCSKLIQLPMGIFDVDGVSILDYNWQPICTALPCGSEGTAQNCDFANKKLFKAFKEHGEVFSTYECSNGLVSTAAAILVDGKHLGSLGFGPFFVNPPDINLLTKQASEIGVDQEQYLRVADQIPLLTIEYVKQFSEIWVSLVKMLAEAGMAKMRHLDYEEKIKRSEARLSTLYNSADIGVSYFTPEGVVIDFNEIALQRMGKTKEQLDKVGNSIIALFPEMEAKIRKVVTSGTSHQFEEKLQYGTHTFWYLTILSCIKNSTGKPEAVQAVSLDITEAKVAQSKLLESEQQLRAIFENSLNAIVLADDQGNYFFVNHAATKMFGFEKEQMLKMNVRQIRTTMPENAAELYKQYLKKGQEVGEFNYLNAAGQERVAEYHAVRIKENFNLSVLTDITDRKKIEIDNERLNIKMQEAYKLAKLGWWELDAKTNAMSWSENLFSMFGFDPALPEPSFAKVMEKHVHPEDSPKLAEKIQRTITEGIPYSIELRIIRSDGTMGYMEARAEPIRDISGKITKVIGTSLDISDRVIAENALRNSEKRFQNMASNFVGAIFQYVLRPDGSDAVIYMSPSCYNIWEVEAEQVLSDASILWQMVHKEDFSGMYRSVRTSADTLKPWNFQWRIITPSGKLKYLEASGRPERKENGDILWDSLILDVTDRVMAEEQLKANEKELYSAIISSEENERFRYSKELHDGLGPILSTSKIYLHYLLEQELPEDSKKALLRTRDLLDEATNSVKEISNNLSPVFLQKYGITQALKSFIEKLQGASDISFKIDSQLKGRFLEVIEITVYRSLIELINNTVKHAQATSVEIQLSYDRNTLKVKYEDNGKGFDPKDLDHERRGFGLLNIENRIKKINGKYTFRPKPGKGVQVKIAIKEPN